MGSDVWDRTDLVFKPYWIADCRIARVEKLAQLASAPVESGRWWFLVDATRSSVSAAIPEDEARAALKSSSGRMLPASLPQIEARAVARAVLAAAIPSGSVARVRADPCRRRIEKGALELEEACLVLVAASLEDRRWQLPGMVPGTPEAAFAGKARSPRR